MLAKIYTGYRVSSFVLTQKVSLYLLLTNYIFYI